MERSGIIEFADKITYENGFYQATLKCNGEIIKKKATFFPSHWSRERVMRTIFEAYEDFMEKGLKPVLSPNGTYRIDALTKDGIKIHMRITKKGVIKTAYPVLK
jgi:hypothetical protein